VVIHRISWLQQLETRTMSDQAAQGPIDASPPKTAVIDAVLADSGTGDGLGHVTNGG
jgi:hypothetical protein